MKTSDILCKFIKMSNRVKFHDGFKEIQRQNAEILNTPGTEIAFVFDIDQTLYTDHKLNKAEDEHLDRVKHDLEEKHCCTKPINWKDEFKKAGSSKIFLKKRFNMSLREISDNWEFKDFKNLKPDYELKEKLDRIKGVKICFTNGMNDRAEEILRLLGLTDCFMYVLCADDEDEDYYLKPNEKAFEFVEEFLGIYNKPESVKNIIFFDDSSDNIKAAKKRGWDVFPVKRVNDVKDLLDTLYELQTGKLILPKDLNEIGINNFSTLLLQKLMISTSESKNPLKKNIRQNPCIANA